jgi:hypothetical protein
VKTLRVLYHMARADFLERTRRYSFLIMLGLVVWLGYLSASGTLALSVPPNYVGEINSPWIGALMTVTVSMFLGWFGFYLVKGSVSRDYETGVGQIMATTPLSRPLYALGKWLSNFAVLGIMILILMVAGILMNLLVGTSGLDLWALVSPLLFIALPCLALVAAVAVLFETISWLRGGFGNIVYFFLFMILLVPNIESDAYQPLLDYAGFRLLGDSIAHAAKIAYPESEGGFNFTIRSNIINPQTFLYDGIAWTVEVILPRFLLLLIAVGIVMLAAAFFDRFNPSRVLPAKKKSGNGSAPELGVSEAVPVPQVHLTPLVGTRTRFRFDALFIAELKLLLKGHRWWWYVVALGLMIAQLTTDLETSRMLLAVAWLWPILLLSGLGSREAIHNTREIVFSAPRPVRNQLPAAWLAAFTIIALLGAGAFLRFIFAGEMTSLLAWMAGALFIPSLALALGVLTGSSKAFEVIYVVWMYIILNRVPPLDFVGVTPASPWPVYALLALALLALAAFARQRQLTASNRTASHG